MDTILRKTPARVAITEFLSSSEFPVDVEQTIKFLRSKNLNTNKVTVYRIIDMLYKNGTISRIELGEGKYRYELQKNHHHHLICTNCGKIEDAQGDLLEDLQSKINKKSGFLIKSHSLEFFGLCKDCQN